MMQKVGFPVDGFVFEFDRSEQLPLQERAKIDDILLKKYTLSTDYIERTYNVEVDEVNEDQSIQTKIKNLYR